MEKVDVTFQDFAKNADKLLEIRPWLLASVDGQGKPNIMAVGATGFGAHPYRYVCEWIRPPCHTAKLIEETGDYTLNLPSEEMEDIVKYCGSVSGRDHDKFKEKNLSPVPSREVVTPIIGECIIHLECRITGIFDPRPESISGSAKEYYEKNQIPKEHYHRLYMAEIIAIYADKNALKDL